MKKPTGKRSAYALLSITLAIVLSAATAFAAGGDRVTAEELMTMLDGPGKVVLIDVRTPAEHREAHIPGSVLMPLQDLGAVEDLPDGDHVVLYCRSGKRSMRAVSILTAKGYADLVDLEGGINAWIRAGGDVVRDGQ